MDEVGSDAGDVEVGPLEEPSTPFLSAPPKSGELSTFAKKLFGEMFVWLCSMVVFGSTINFVVANSTRSCSSLCGYAIATSVISALITSLILIGHYLTWTTKMDRGSWFNSKAECNFMGFLVVWWAAGVGGLSAVVTEDITIPKGNPTATVNITEAFNAAINETVTFQNVSKSMDSIKSAINQTAALQNFTKSMEALEAVINNTATIHNIPKRVLVVHAPDIGVFFGWLAFFGAIYTTFKSYHASKEEQRA